MTVSELIGNYHKHNLNGHFFDAETLKFFGERRSEMRVLKETASITDWSGQKHMCYVLSSLQRNYPLGAKRAYHYFDIATFDSIEPAPKGYFDKGESKDEN